MTSSRRDVAVPGRALAVISLTCGVLFAVATVVFLVRNGLYVLAGVAGFMLAVGGGWWTITERMPRRAVGGAGVLVGVGIIVAALFAVDGDHGSTVVRTALTIGLLAVALVTARAALSGSLHRVVSRATRRAVPPRHPVLLCNPRSGGGKVEKFGLIELASSLGIETVTLGPGLDLAELARAAIDRGADCLGMAGGDGSQALVASIAVEHNVPFVCVSAGTRNHFALDLGLDRNDPRKSLYAYRDAIERHVDFATVNGRFFVNNVSLGVYATIVQQEGYREAKADTSTRLLPELLGRTTEPFDLQFVAPDGHEVDGAFLVMVSNNPYVLGASLDASQRRYIDSGQLGVFAVTARTGAQAAEVVALALGHRSARSAHAFEFTAETFEVRSKSTKAFAGIDGESLELDTPLEFRIHPRGLRMLVPEGNIEIMVRRQARDVRIGDLVSLARGVSPRG